MQAGDAMLADAAGDDAGVVAEIRRDVQRDAVPAHPTGDADTDRGDLFLNVAGRDPDADAPLASLAANAEVGEGANQPFLQPVHVAADVARRDRAMRTS